MASMSSSSSSSSVWTCESCTMENKSSSSACETCGTPNPAVPIVQRSGSVVSSAAAGGSGSGVGSGLIGLVMVDDYFGEAPPPNMAAPVGVGNAAVRDEKQNQGRPCSEMVAPDQASAIDLVKKAAALTISKTKSPTGTFYNSPFQLDLSQCRGSLTVLPTSLSQEPISVPLFDTLGFHCVPHCGVYGENYEPLLPYLLVKLPAVGVYQTLPSIIQDNLALTSEDSLDSYLMVHGLPQRGPCQHFTCTNTDEINIMLHAWAFPELKFSQSPSFSTDVICGVFDAFGVTSVHLDLSPKSAGAPVGVLDVRTVETHNQRFSPCNNQLRLLEGDVHCFYTVARHHHRCVVAHHVIAGSEASDKLLQSLTFESSTLVQVLQKLNDAGQIWRFIVSKWLQMLQPAIK